MFDFFLSLPCFLKAYLGCHWNPLTNPNWQIIAISFYHNIVCKNVSCDMGLDKSFLTPFLFLSVSSLLFLLFSSFNQRVLYNKTRESVEIYTAAANNVPWQKEVRIWIQWIYAMIFFAYFCTVFFKFYSFPVHF